MKTFKALFAIALFVAAISTSCSKEPTACFSVAQDTVSLGQNVVCDASCSVDAEKYNWSADGPYTIAVTGTSAVKQEFTFSTPGVYTIKLIVENGSRESRSSEVVTVIP